VSPTRTTDGSGEKPGIMGFSNFIGTLVIRVYGLADEVETGLDTEVKENRKVECDDLPQRRRHYQAHLQPAPGCGDSSGASFRGQAVIFLCSIQRSRVVAAAFALRKLTPVLTTIVCLRRVELARLIKIV